MASFNGTRIPGPMFNQNFSPRNLNESPGGGRQQFFSTPFEHPERFVPGSFPNRPPFSNFRNPAFSPGYRNIPPIPENASPANVLSAPRPRFGGSYERHFTPWNQLPSFIPQRQPFQNHPRSQMSLGNNRNQPFQNHPRPQMPLGNNRNQPFQNHPLPQMPLGNNGDQPFQNRFGPPMPPGNNRDQPFYNRPRLPMPPGNNRNWPNRQRNQKPREFRKLKSWMTDELFAEVKKKNALYLKAKSSDKQTFWQEFRLQRNRVSSLIKEAKIKAGLISRKIKEDDNIEKAFSCDTCDRAFITDNELNRHLSEHITCDQGDCTFEAHPKIVAIHKKMQHETGYAERINKLKDDAEIQKWREERRSRFPTAENIRKRQAEQAEREARGEVLETKDFGKFKRQRTEDGNPRNQGNRRKMRHNRGNRNFRDRRHSNFQSHPTFRPITMDMDSGSDSDNDSHITLKRFSGILPLATSVCDNHNNEDKVELNASNVENDMDQSPSKKTEQNLPYVENDMDQSSSKTEQNLPKCDSSKPLNIQNLTIADKGCSSVMKSDESTFQSNDKSKEGNSASSQPSGYSREDRVPRAGPSGYNREDRMPRAGPSGSNAEGIRPRVRMASPEENRLHRPRVRYIVEGTITPEDSGDELLPPGDRPVIRTANIADIGRKTFMAAMDQLLGPIANNRNPGAVPVRHVNYTGRADIRARQRAVARERLRADVALNPVPNPIPTNRNPGDSDDEAPVAMPILRSKDTAAGSSKDLPKDIFRDANSNAGCSNEKPNLSDTTAGSSKNLPKGVSRPGDSNLRCSNEMRNFNDLAESSLKRAKLDCDTEISSVKDCNGNFLNTDITPTARSVPENYHQTTNSDAGCVKENSINTGNEQGRRHGDRSHHNDRFNREQNPAFVARKSTLLEKLLANDIRHERNIILQCVRHIVNKNFFGIGGNTS